MATLYIIMYNYVYIKYILKYAKKCEKKCFFPNYKWAWSLLARGWIRQCKLLSRQKIINIMVVIRSRLILWSDFTNFWFFKIKNVPNHFFLFCFLKKVAS